jgi:hypothetical protein
MTRTYEGNDNHGKPKSEYIGKLQGMDDTALLAECESKIWLSAYANNNPRSDYHWHCDATYDECERRGKPDLYKKAYDALTKDL